MRRIIAFFKHPVFVSVYMATTLAFAIYYLYNNWKTISSIWGSVRYDNLSYAVIFSLFTLLGYVYVNFAIYRQLGAPISYWNTLKIVMASRIGLYVPGKIWYASNFYMFSRRFGLSSLIIGQNFVLTNILNFLTGGICSLPFVFPFLSTPQRYLLILTCLILFALSHPTLLNRVSSLFPNLREEIFKDLYFRRFSSLDYFKFVAYYALLVWVVAAVALCFCIAAVSPAEASHFPTVLAANCASVLLGMLAIFAPAGIGVREGVGVFILSTVIPTHTAVVVMLISRLIMAIFDLVGGILSFVLFNKPDSTRRTFQKSTNCQARSIPIK